MLSFLLLTGARQYWTRQLTPSTALLQHQIQAKIKLWKKDIKISDYYRKRPKLRQKRRIWQFWHLLEVWYYHWNCLGQFLRHRSWHLETQFSHTKKMIWANNHSVTLWCASSLSHIFLPFQIFYNAFEISPRHLVDSKFLQHLLQIFMQIVFSPIGADIFSGRITLAKTRTLSASPKSKTQKYCQRHNITGPVSCHQPIFNTLFNLKISKSDNINNFVFGALFT